MDARQGLKIVKEMQREMTDRKVQEKQDKVKRRKEQEERKKANALKAEVVQVVCFHFLIFTMLFIRYTNTIGFVSCAVLSR